MKIDFFSCNTITFFLGWILPLCFRTALPFSPQKGFNIFLTHSPPQPQKIILHAFRVAPFLCMEPSPFPFFWLGFERRFLASYVHPFFSPYSVYGHLPCPPLVRFVCFLLSLFFFFFPFTPHYYLGRPALPPNTPTGAPL